MTILGFGPKAHIINGAKPQLYWVLGQRTQTRMGFNTGFGRGYKLYWVLVEGTQLYMDVQKNQVPPMQGHLRLPNI